MRSAGSSNGYQLYEIYSPVSDEPIRIALSEDGKCLWFAVTNVPSYADSNATALVITAFSAVYRHVPENLEEILASNELFTGDTKPDERLGAFLKASSFELREDAWIRKSLPIHAPNYRKAPVATIYQDWSGGKRSYFVIFESEGL